MTSNTTNRRGNMGAMIRALRPLGPAATNDPHKNRQLVADFCRLVGANLGSASPGADLPPRVRQTLTSLLNGASEKEIASTLRLSHHTVHVYVKQIYKHYSVSSRAELLARWVKA
jgi:DNA-binding NarL/FixJ family response regulator